jgi:hypothetical protein
MSEISDDITCPTCTGAGWTSSVKMVCCGYPVGSECCGDPYLTEQHVECDYCCGQGMVDVFKFCEDKFRGEQYGRN